MEKIKQIRKFFLKLNLDGYIIPKNDEYFNEYINSNNDNLKYITNFSGSYGFAIILKKKNFLFVDGRYTLQAEKQSKKFFEIITIPQAMPVDVFKKKKLRIGYDPKLHTHIGLLKLFKKTKCSLVKIQNNLVDQIWIKRKINREKKFFILSDKVVGKSKDRKIQSVLNILKKRNVDFHFISNSENVAWMLNIRGHDSPYAPIPNCRVLLKKTGEIIFFCKKNKISRNFMRKFKKTKFLDEVKIAPYFQKIYNKKILVDPNSCSIFLRDALKNKNFLIEKLDPIYYLKSRKNKIEIRNSENIHVADGVALTKFLIWLKNNYQKKEITELQAQQKLLKFRMKNKSFLHPSFPTISGTGPNGAIIHYKANLETNRKLRLGDIYLVDSGGQYNYGTTDVTRTVSLNNKNLRIRNIFTLVLKGHIAVSNFKLKKDTSGSDIDKVAREPLRKVKLDYPHGTGHGVGYYLNVHEGPQALSKNNFVSLKEGMILSNEPGYYEKNKFGIRIENLITIKKKINKLFFENLTLVPIEKDLINKNLLDNKEKDWLNRYHKTVFEKLKNFMNKEEKRSLKLACLKI